MASIWITFLILGTLGYHQCQGRTYIGRYRYDPYEEESGVYNGDDAYPTDYYGTNMPYTGYVEYSANVPGYGSSGTYQSFYSPYLADLLYRLKNGYPVEQYQYGVLKQKVLVEFGKLIKLIRAEQSLQTEIASEYDNHVVEVITRILKSAHSPSKSSISRARLTKLRNALLEFLFPNTNLAQDLSAGSGQPAVPPNQTEVVQAVAIAGGDAGNSTQVASAGVSIVNGTTQDQVPNSPSASATTVVTSDGLPYQALSPTNLNLVKLLQVYGSGAGVPGAETTTAVPVPTVDAVTPTEQTGSEGTSGAGVVDAAGQVGNNLLSMLG